MKLTKQVEEVKLDLQVSPLIDVVFLLLIYFLVTATLIKKEGDISFILPARADDSTMITLPVEVVIMIAADGTVEVDGITFSPNDINLEELATQIRGLKAIADSQRTTFFVNLLPAKDAVHRRIVNVMDACAAAEVKNLSFSKAML
jgi:biopolymer transport protein ExbD